MKFSELSTEQIRAYFNTRLQNVRPVVQQMLRCPFHEDRTASLSLNLDKGAWKCHAGCGGGGLIDFEMKFSNLDRGAAYAEICRVLGLEYTPSVFSEEPEAIYRYRDPREAVVFEKLRLPGKQFRIRHQDEHGKWLYAAPAGTKPLYHLPGVITANVVVICEGEKDADNVNALNLAQYHETGFTRLAATTNFDGAGKWNAAYSPYLAGKVVIILPDNDAVGRAHAKTVAQSAFPYAFSVRIVELPGLPEKGDVSDYLQTHSGADLWQAMVKTPCWEPEKSALLVPAPAFLERETSDIDWLVAGVIQRGANGFIVASPKVGKSWCAVGLALADALGEPWLGLKTERAPVALITREDNPNLTRWRMGRLLAGRQQYAARLEEWLWINSKDQSPQFRIDEPAQLAEMIETLRRIKPELVILDVFNVLHSADENDNSEMRKVMESAEAFSRELKASVCILHHFNKGQGTRLADRMRGAGAIGGWAEWIIGLQFASDKPDEKLRSMQFESKAGTHEPIYFTIETTEGHSYLTPKEYQPRQTGKKPRFQVAQ